MLIKVNLKISSLIQNISYFLLTLSRSNAACPEFSTSMFLKEAEMQKQLKYDFPITIKILSPITKTIWMSIYCKYSIPLQQNVWKIIELFPLPSMVFILMAHRMKSPNSTFPSLLLYLMTRALNVLLLKRKPKSINNKNK